MSTITQTTTQPPSGSLSFVPPAAVSLDGYDEEQVRLMEERCILVNPNDEAYGEGSKKQCEYIFFHMKADQQGIALTPLTVCSDPSR